MFLKNMCLKIYQKVRKSKRAQLLKSRKNYNKGKYYTRKRFHRLSRKNLHI